MKNVDWSQYKFHCSGLGNLMTSSRKKGELLSETTKAYLRELYIKEVWGREKTDMLANKYTQKGIACETDSIALLQKYTKITYFKNQKTLSNEYVVGTPDIIVPTLIDVKTSWDIFTFASVDEDRASKDYGYQLLGYEWLTGHKKASLAYCLVDTPDDMMTDELYRLSFKIPEDQVDLYRHNYKFSDIPETIRVKKYDFIYDEALVEELKGKIIAGREYLSNFTI